MLDKITGLFSPINIEALDQFADKVGLTSIFTSLGITIARDVSGGSWALADYALMISCIGGILFIIEKIILITIRIRESRRLDREAAQKRKSRGLPK